MSSLVDVTPYFRICPKCNCIVYYDHPRLAKNAIKRNKPCTSCVNKKPPTGITTRSCPECSCTITYCCEGTCKAAIKQNKLCLSCAGKRRWTPELRKLESEKQKALIAEPHSIWHTDEYKQHKSEGLKRAHQDPTSIWNTKEWREHQSWTMTQYALSGSHPFQNLSSGSYQRMIEQTRLSWINPSDKRLQFIAWRKTPEGHAWASKISKKFRAEHPTFQSDSYKQKIRINLTRIRKLVGNFHSSKYEFMLTDALNKIDHRFVHNQSGPQISVGPYHPDIINIEKRIIVEFQGDYCHSHPDKYPDDFWNAVCRHTAKEVRERDIKRKEFIEAQGWQVIVVWESDWKSKRDEIINMITSLSMKQE